jgi:hypothetical protein
MENNTDVEIALFYPGSQYIGEHNDLPTGSGYNYPYAMEAAVADRS